MIYDIEKKELRSFTYITSVYKCIAAYNLKGHQIGRKVGDMLEILTMEGVHQCPELVSHLNTEGKLEGYTTAGHKVEFGFYHDVKNKSGLFGAIECKCVGVEETKAGTGQSHLRKLTVGNSFSLDFDAHWMKNTQTQKIKLVSHTNTTATIELTNSHNKDRCEIKMSVGDNIKIVITEDGLLQHTTPGGNMLEEIPKIIRICKTIKLDQITDKSCQFSLYNCLTGPQTIEKAKQASFVAMDLRKKVDGHWGKEEVPADCKQMNFLHVICEFSHWEEKSRNIIKTCIDHNIIVPDAVLIKAFSVFEDTFGVQNMLDKISKRNYSKIPKVKAAIAKVFAHFEGHIFYDIESEAYIQFGCSDGKLIVMPID